MSNKDYITRTFTSVEVTATVMNKETKSLETITATLPKQKDEAQLEKRMKKYCEAKGFVFCMIESWKAKNVRKRMSIEKFLNESEEY